MVAHENLSLVGIGSTPVMATIFNAQSKPAMENRTVEQQVADVILGREIASIEINGEVYKVAPPSIATLIMASEIISTLPIVEPISKDDPEKSQKIFREVLKTAKDFKALGELAAVLILGAKGLYEETIIEEPTRRLFGILRSKKRTTKTIDKRARLAKAIMEEMTPSKLFDLLLNRINGLEIGNFFAITTSLSEVNILKPTREVGN